ncbi:hypothetical protein [Shinella zoogloeoides]|uniref:hypothetical protein n=1 Tax=Shinella zoogloeoides TaxID=352475 RepID=UPI00299DD446|nr:hypothetical protein [Shinella zoogloeoides]WPE19966.1 hypothetical protein ShzoTeo12_11460 [Shinella zoogloeoides]
MTIQFPRDLPAVGYQQCDLILRDGVVASPSGSAPAGRMLINYTQVSPTVWEATLGTVPMTFDQFSEFEAWWLTLRGMRAARFRRPFNGYPRAHRENHAPAEVTGLLGSVTNGNELVVNGVSPGLVLSVGDQIGLERLNRFYLGRVVEVSGSGTTRNLTVEPPPFATVSQPNAVVRFVRPVLIMRPVPDSYEVSVSGDFLYSVTCKLMESA